MTGIGTTSRPGYRPGATVLSPADNVFTRWLNVALGVWLSISAFIWPHSASETTNTCLVGVAIAVAALVAMFVRWVRWVNTALAIWLFVTAFAFPYVRAGTVWNNAVVGMAVFLVSLMAGVPDRAYPHVGRDRAHAARLR